MSASGTEDALDAISSGLDYPMVIVTARDAEGEQSGCLVGFTTQCSIEPYRYAVMISAANHTHQVAMNSGALAVHFLASDQQQIAELFGEQTGDDIDKFARCEWTSSESGPPVLSAAGRWLAGPVISTHDCGDHSLFVIEPTEAAAGESWPGQFSFRQAKPMDPGHAP